MNFNLIKNIISLFLIILFLSGSIASLNGGQPMGQPLPVYCEKPGSQECRMLIRCSGRPPNRSC